MAIIHVGLSMEGKGRAVEGKDMELTEGWIVRVIIVVRRWIG